VGFFYNAPQPTRHLSDQTYIHIYLSLIIATFVQTIFILSTNHGIELHRKI